MRKISTIILVATIFFAQAQNSKTAIKEKATEVAQATLNSDWQTLIKYTYPKLVQLLGGEEQMVATIVSSMEQQNIKFISADIGEPGEIYSTGEDNLFSLIPQTIVIQMPNGKLQTESHLLAVSENKGQNWYFIDTAQLTMSNVQELLPNYNMDLTIPPKKQPIFLGN